MMGEEVRKLFRSQAREHKAAEERVMMKSIPGVVAITLLISLAVIMSYGQNHSIQAAKRSLIYVTNNGSNGEGNTVSVIDTNTHTVVATVTVDTGPGDVAVTPNGKFAYVANSSTHTVSVID